ncbi:MAG: hypothetical protein C0513_07630 [Isosphaera sp.]|nr:hypothetical protein [Isosphaera sp.]
MAQLDVMGWVLLACLGLIGGLLGGLAGVGGSMLFLPGLHWLMGSEPPDTHHVYIATAFVTNLAVAVPSALRHRARGAVRRDLLPTLAAATLAAVVCGVLLGTLINGQRLRLLLAGFIACYCLYNTRRLLSASQRAADTAAQTDRRAVPRRVLAGIGVVSGLVAGLLGLGGGVLLVPLLQTLGRVPLRQSIATSSWVICLTAGFAAVVKLSSLPARGLSVREALAIAAVLLPGAVVGSRLGARLTHELPVAWVRGVITVVLLGAAGKLIGAW